MTGMDTASMIPWIMSGSLIRATPPWTRMSAGTRSRAMTATAPASSAIFAWSGVTTSMITPPLSISAMPRLTRAVPILGPLGALAVLIESVADEPLPVESLAVAALMVGSVELTEGLFLVVSALWYEPRGPRSGASQRSLARSPVSRPGRHFLGSNAGRQVPDISPNQALSPAVIPRMCRQPVHRLEGCAQRLRRLVVHLERCRQRRPARQAQPPHEPLSPYGARRSHCVVMEAAGHHHTPAGSSQILDQLRTTRRRVDLVELARLFHGGPQRPGKVAFCQLTFVRRGLASLVRGLGEQQRRCRVQQLRGRELQGDR